MDDPKVEELKSILKRRGQKILGDPALLDNVLKESSLSPAERVSLVAAAKLGFPQTLLDQQDSTVPAAGFASYFNRLTREMSIDDDSARAALQRWASTFGRTAPADPAASAQARQLTPRPAPAATAPGADRAVYVQAYRLLRQGKSPPQAAAELQSSGLDAATATMVVAKVAHFMKLMRDAYRQAGWKSVGIGLLWCVGGILVTAVTFAMASGGGTYFVAWGAVVLGFIQAIRGLFISFRQASEDDVVRLSGLQ